MYVRQIWEATPGDTFVHRLDGRTKLIILAVTGLTAVIIDSSRTLSHVLDIRSSHFIKKPIILAYAL